MTRPTVSPQASTRQRIEEAAQAIDQTIGTLADTVDPTLARITAEADPTPYLERLTDTITAIVTLADLLRLLNTRSVPGNVEHRTTTISDELADLARRADAYIAANE